MASDEAIDKVFDVAAGVAGPVAGYSAKAIATSMAGPAVGNLMGKGVAVGVEKCPKDVRAMTTLLTLSGATAVTKGVIVSSGAYGSAVLGVGLASMAAGAILFAPVAFAAAWWMHKRK